MFSQAPGLQEVVANLMGLLLKGVAILGVLAFVITGILYLTSAGNQYQVERAKKYLKYSIVGLVVAIGSLIIINLINKLLQ